MAHNLLVLEIFSVPTHTMIFAFICLSHSIIVLMHDRKQHPDTSFKMVLLLLLMVLTSCAALPQNMADKMFTFPQETNTAHVRLTVTTQNLGAVSVCFRSFTDLTREHAFFSLATPSASNDILIIKKPRSDLFDLLYKNVGVGFPGQDYKQNTWHSICTTWDSTSGLGQLWLDGMPSSRKFISSGSDISGPIIIVLGQDQDNHGGGFDVKQSFTGMMSDVHMWDYILSPCEIMNYVDDQNLTPGSVLNWNSLDFQIVGRVLIEDKQKQCL
ncbi:C-reactive protein-like [Mugil cephalus]|uniref:C-reactive protein-like n=1 Tax=Mugil cephalus TaxID=48193 RepID=UPI001FB5B477|nr:C-reactive protein-like [Mugil cephalus]